MSVVNDLQEYLTARRTAIDAALLSALPSPPSCPPAVADAMRYSISAGGKRLRPILCLASAEAVGGEWQQAMPAACALEFIHTYSLIHDDLPAMDNDVLRRGQPARPGPSWHRTSSCSARSTTTSRRGRCAASTSTARRTPAARASA